jgi:hypothetical protein
VETANFNSLSGFKLSPVRAADRSLLRWLSVDLPTMTLRTAFKELSKRRPQLVLAFAGLLTLAWLGLLVWVSAGIIELI